MGAYSIGRIGFSVSQANVAQRSNPLDEKIRKRAQGSLQLPLRGFRCNDPCSMIPGDLWEALNMEAEQRQNLSRANPPTIANLRQLDEYKKKLGLQVQAMACEDIFYTLQQPGLSHFRQGNSNLHQYSERLLTLYAKVYCTKAEQLSDDILLALLKLDISLFSEPDATMKAYCIKYLKQQKHSFLHTQKIQQWTSELRQFLTPDCIDKFIHILNQLSANSLRGWEHDQLQMDLEKLGRILMEAASQSQYTTQVLDALIEINYILRNYKLTATIILATRYPDLEDHYLSIVENAVLIPTEYHSIEALYFKASFNVCQYLQECSRRVGQALGVEHDLGFQNYQLSYAFSLNTPLPIVRLIPLIPTLNFHYLQEAIKAKCSSEVILYLLAEVKKQQVKPQELTQVFELALEHNAPLDVIQTFIVTEGVRPSNNSFYYAFKRSPLTRNIMELLLEHRKDISWHELVNYLNKSIHERLSLDLILFLLNKVFHTHPKENSETKSQELAHCFQQALIHSAPIQVLQAFIQQGGVEPNLHHIFSVLYCDAPDQQVISFLCQFVKPDEITPSLRAKAQAKGISLPHVEGAV